MRNIIKRIALGFVLGIGIAATFHFWLPTSANSISPLRFWISNLEGKQFDSRKHTGPLVISFFFVDCVPCLKEVPQLHAVMRSEFPGVPLLFVDPLQEDSVSYVKEFANRVKVPYAFFYRDPLARMAKKFFQGRMVFPTIVGLKNGRELYRIHDLSPPALELIREGMAN